MLAAKIVLCVFAVGVLLSLNVLAYILLKRSEEHPFLALVLRAATWISLGLWIWHKVRS